MSSSSEKNVGTGAKKKKVGSIRSIFMHADAVDKWLMTVGMLGAVGDGVSSQLLVLFVCLYINKMGRAGASGLDAHNFQSNNELIFTFIYLACASWFACFIEGYCWTRTAARQAARMRSKYLKAVLYQDVGYFDLHVTSTSEVLTTISNDIQIIQDVLTEKVPDCLSKVATFIAGCSIAFVLMWDLAIVGLPFVLLLILPGWICGRRFTELARKRREECIKAGSIAEQAISSIRTVYAYAGENSTMYQFSEALRGTIKLGLKQGMIKGLVIGSAGTIFANWAAMSYYGSRKVIYHSALGGTILAVGQSMVYGGVVLGAALSNMKYIAEACSAGDHILEIVNRVPEIDLENTAGRTLGNVTSKVEFNHVKFAYPSRPGSIILDGFCLSVPAGKTVALVGSSGSGKSTVISLLQRFYNPLEGEILLNGVAIDRLQLKWLRSQMASVSQEPSLFSITITENILLGKEDGTREEIVEAAKASNAHDFICQLPQGYDTQVGERGSQVSGGQKQRIAIARALIKKPRILLLDEATSALDSESERLVQEALHRAAMGRTTIVIAHRLSTIRNADLIGVMQNGRVIETGSHNELIQNQNGLYSSFVRLQQRETETPEHQFQCAGTSTTTLPVIESPLRLTSQLGGSDSTTAEQYPNMVTPKSSVWRLLLMTYPEWKQAILGCFSAIMFGAVQPLYGLTMGTTLSVFFLTNHDEIKERIRILAFCYLGLFLFAFLTNIIQHYNFTYMGEYLTNRIRETLLSKILTFEVAWFDEVQNSSSAICARLTSDAELVRSLVGDRMGLLVQTISAVTVAWVMGLIIAWRLAILIIAIQPIVILSLYAKRVLLKRISNSAIKAQEESCKLAAEAIYNHRTVTAFMAQNRILKMLDNAQESPRRENLRQSWFAGIGLGFAECITIMNWGLSYWYGSRLVHQGYLTPKSVFETVLILVTTGRVIADAGSMTSDLAMGLDAIKSIFKILDRTTRIEPQAPKEPHVEKLTGHVDFHDVYFAYPTRPNVMVFQGFSISFEAGKSTALVGQSGSGKSTVIGLIERFYDPNQGVVKIDGWDVKSYNLRSLRKHMALVSQEPTLFAGTIRENIVYGASDKIDEMMIIEAARSADAHDFISGLNNGYNTLCGDKGLQLSGGQKQRIATARAILRKPAVLLLDEATSALDSQSEKVLQDSLERLRFGRTTVVVAHRLSTIQNCELIVVLDKGKVVEKGTHSSLLSKGPAGSYYSLVNLSRTQSSKV